MIFSRAGPSVAFLWVPFLFPQKEMEQNKYAISVAVGGRITNPYIRSDWITNPVEQTEQMKTESNKYPVGADLQSARNKYHPTLTSPIQRLLLTVS